MSDYTGVGLVHALCVREDATLMSNNNGGCTQLGVQPPPWLQSGAGNYSAPLEESLHHTGNYSAPLAELVRRAERRGALASSSVTSEPRDCHVRTGDCVCV